MPRSRPVIHTLVATNSVSSTPRSAVRSPTTDSAVPYIGDESITRPPRATKRSSTLLRGARSAAESPTSKVRHVPRPTAGIASPLRGMRRSSRRACAPARVGAAGPAAAAAISASAVRRVIGLSSGSRRTMFTSIANNALAARQVDRDDDPERAERHRDERDAGDAETEAQERGEDPPRHGIPAPRHHGVDDVLRLVLLLAAHHREED